MDPLCAIFATACEYLDLLQNKKFFKKRVHLTGINPNAVHLVKVGVIHPHRLELALSPAPTIMSLGYVVINHTVARKDGLSPFETLLQEK